MTTTDPSSVPIPDAIEHECSGTLVWEDTAGPVWLVGCTGCAFTQGIQRERVLPDDRIANWQRTSRLPARYRGLDFEPRAGTKAAREAAGRVLGGGDKGVVYVGEPGRGKTHLLTRLGERFIAEKQRRVAYMTLAELLEDIRRSFDGAPREALYMRAETADVLILDDIGAEKATEWSQERVTLLLDSRIRTGRGLLLAGTNMMPDEWSEQIGKRAASRMLEMAEVVQVEGPDHRAG